MAFELDLEGIEIRILHKLIDFTAKDVLEIGCGDGRLTWRYADRAASVLALDPKEAKIALARQRMPETWRSRVTFHVADITTVDLREAAFDVAVLSWSV